MRASGQTRDRPEQLLAAAIIEYHLLSYGHVATEKFIKLRNPDTPGVLKEIHVDITVSLGKTLFALELHGPYHDEKKQMRKDRIRELILRHNGWEYAEIKYHDAPALYSKGKITYKKIAMAYDEIVSHIDAVIPLKPLGMDRQSLVEFVLCKTKLS